MLRFFHVGTMNISRQLHRRGSRRIQCYRVASIETLPTQRTLGKPPIMPKPRNEGTLGYTIDNYLVRNYNSAIASLLGGLLLNFDKSWSDEDESTFFCDLFVTTIGLAVFSGASARVNT